MILWVPCAYCVYWICMLRYISVNILSLGYSRHESNGHAVLSLARYYGLLCLRTQYESHCLLLHAVA
jgi:hypothetical protein